MLYWPVTLAFVNSGFMNGLFRVSECAIAMGITVRNFASAQFATYGRVSISVIIRWLPARISDKEMSNRLAVPKNADRWAITEPSWATS